MNTIRFFIVMGVLGSGKSTVSKALAESLDGDFFDADDFHPPAMLPRWQAGFRSTTQTAPRGWLHDLISYNLKHNEPGVLACSALKEWYRQQLMNGNEGVQLVYLKGSYDLIWSRMAVRKEHYMQPEMLQSQFDTLEEPANALTIDISMPVKKIL